VNNASPSRAEPQLVLTADGSFTLLDLQSGAHYHSIHGARSESEHVFIRGGEVAHRLALKPSLAVLEIGLGTGLNALLTILEAQKAAKPLKYTAYEPFPVRRELLEAFYAGQSDLQPFLSLLIEPTAKLEGVDFDLRIAHWVPATEPEPVFDIVYFDLFAKTVEPDFWQAPVLARLLEWCKPGGCLVSYGITGELKRGLKAMGIPFDRPKGFAAKREMLRVFKP